MNKRSKPNSQSKEPLCHMINEWMEWYNNESNRETRSRFLMVTLHRG
jgi:hypothetical protein